MKEDYKESVAKEKLAESRSERERLLAKWGFEPISMWWLQKIHNPTLDVLVEDTLAAGSYPSHNFNVRDGALPQSSPIVAERIIKFWSEEGDKVFNPFFERIPHLLVANYLKREAYGYDICKKFYEHSVEKVKKRIHQSAFLDPEGNIVLAEDDDSFISMFNGLRFELRLADSRKIHYPDNMFDLIVNSPPYWNTIYYGPEPEQLGTGKIGAGDKPTYEEFLKGLQDVYRECYRVLKPGKFLVTLLNDFRLNKKFYPYHMDCTRICLEIGWELHDLIVYNLSTHPLQAIFSSQLERDKHTAKCHETILIFRKPN